MDLAHALWQLVAATIILLLAHWYMKRKQLFNYFKELGIPGPEPSIITGNMNRTSREGEQHTPLSALFVFLTPTVAYREWIEKYGKVVGYFNGSRPVLLVADLDLLKMIQVKDFQDFH
ncbi:hypothetical protein MRX96_023495 [Rhipicephalus microplus]